MFIPIEFQKALQKTAQQAVAIDAAYTDSPALMQSRFGGLPYWESGRDVPVDDHDEPLALLAQINFAEVPAHALLPSQGILQLFIPKSDDYYGADLDAVGAAGQLRSQFWPEPNADKAIDWPDESTSVDDLIPVFGAHVLSFNTKTESAGIDTIECAAALGANPFEVLEDVALNEKEETLFYDAIVDYTASHGHKLLGYPYFTQGEPREGSEYRLLLQIDTDMDGDNDIMWGDNGVGHVFIQETDLHAQRFDRLWFYWDC